MGILDNKAALVTGASANLGKAVAESFAAEGASVMVHYNRPRKGGAGGENRRRHQRPGRERRPASG